ncbi:hypothetical protein E2C01_021674 [Portunus trituberculatus]|uniref:Uncharacterized protein n=1 Tax=Portunus trituberculatus TaxID=210409 RepID=A0A5B7E546_PORTR|nr:hypothetical protein [Portunus trituberculatus]
MIAEFSSKCSYNGCLNLSSRRDRCKAFPFRLRPGPGSDSTADSYSLCAHREFMLLLRHSI